ncbi:MAG: chain-length determining protein [Bacteroidales bacterium]|nr:chain-length determining protein [Bacteroidales bacterium]
MSKKEFDDFDFDDFDDGAAAREPIDLKPYIRTALRNWKPILVWAICGMAFGIMIGLSTPKTYTTRAVVAPELVTRATASSGLSTLASLAGLNMNSVALSDAMHPDLYPVIINSTNFYIKLFDMPVTLTKRDSLIHTDLYDYVANHTRKPWWGYVIGFPQMALGSVKSLVVKKDEIDDAEGHDTVDSLRLTKQQENVIKALSKSISASVEKKTFAISVRVTMQDKKVAADLANAIIENLKQFVLEYRTEKARDNVEYYEGLYEETRAEYQAAQKAAAYYADSHLGGVTQSSKIYLQQLQNEAQLRYQMYNTTAQNLLTARAKVQHEAPVLVVIQPGIAPHYGKPSKVKLGLLWFVIGAALGTFVILRKNKA